MFSTIRTVARSGIAPEHFIRQLVAQGKCPGLYSGNRFLVNVEALKKYLEESSQPKGGSIA